MGKFLRGFIYIALYVLFSFIYCSRGSEVKDLIPPSAVIDLRVSYIDYYGAQIEFTAPGDDLMRGTASEIELRYSQDESFKTNLQENFVKGIEFPEASSPPPAGGKVKIFLKNLEPNTKYFVAVRVWDDAGNFSYSNVVEFQTKDVPGTSGEFIGKIDLQGNFFAVASDGKDAYLMFPGIYKIKVDSVEYKLEPISDGVPPISGAQIIWDGEKFVSVGGVVGDELVDSPLGIFPDGRVIILENRGKIIPFGENGFFGFGLLGHKVSKIDGNFVILGGTKFNIKSLSYAREIGRFSRVGLERLISFKVEGSSIIWDEISPYSLTLPTARIRPSVFAIDEKSVLMWGGITSDLDIAPEKSMYALSKNQDGKYSWNPFLPYSISMIYGVKNSCEAESIVRILKVKQTEYGEIDEGVDLDKNIPPQGTVFLWNGEKVILKGEEVVRRVVIVGDFTGQENFSGMVGVYIYQDGRVVFTKLKPKAKFRKEFVFPRISPLCSATFQDNKFLYILNQNEIYVFRFKDYEVIFEDQVSK